MRFIILSIISSGISFLGAMFPGNQSGETAHYSTLFLQIIFVWEKQITKSDINASLHDHVFTYFLPRL